VVTLNCAGSVLAAAEAAVLQPDILLLQESPSASHLELLCEDLYGGKGQTLWGPDCSILARGKTTPVISSASKCGECALAQVRLTLGIDVVPASFRRHLVLLRTDLWSPDCWRAYTQNRRTQRRQLQAIANDASSNSGASSLILDGDFNAPEGDPVFDALPKELSDAFREAEVGWGNTILNDWPVHWIDQIWSGNRLRAITAYTQTTSLLSSRGG
jgi:vancomycin resistance protein VanJ